MIAFLYGLSQLVCRLFFRLGFGLEIRGREHIPRRGAFILASNHFSYLDPPLIGSSCPRRVAFMARSNLFRHPVLGAYLRGVGVIPLQRESGDLPALRAAIRTLSQGQPLAIFPEGGRQLSGRLGAAKRGVGLLAMEARVPIVPVLVRGTFQALPPGARGLRRAKIQVAFGPLIPYTEASFLEAGGPQPASGEGRGGPARRRAQEARLAEAVTLAWRRLEEDSKPVHERPHVC
jgi:1-acyl-sn-glycerol-3-phosphate acyltransferase